MPKLLGRSEVYTVQIVGPMTGCPNFNYDTFDQVAEYIRGSGLERMERTETGFTRKPYLAINPADNFNRDQTRPRREYIALSMRQVAEADGIVLLPRWSQSEGARLEAQTALDLGKDFYIAWQEPCFDGESSHWQIGATSAEIIQELLNWSEVAGFEKPSAYQPYAGVDRINWAGEQGPEAVGFVVKDSGAREEYASGMVRDTQAGKPDFTLIDLAFLERWAHHMTKGAQKYGRDNWRLASGEEELTRFRGSAFRHLVQWLEGESTEDHAAAVAFNIAAAEYVKARLNEAS